MNRKRYYFTLNGRDLYFTQREKEVSILFIKDKTQKSIAKELGVSPRTVESYVDNIKLKCGVHKKQLLIKLLKNLLNNQ